MSRFSPAELRDQIAGRLLCFPVTHATADLRLDRSSYQEHLEHLATFAPGAMTAPGATGEFFSLTRDDVRATLAAAVEVRPERSAVLGAAAFGTATAIEMARGAEEQGADGLFLLPTYLASTSQAGLIAHVQQVCAATSLGVLLYHRGSSLFTADSVLELARTCPNLVALKDGAGDIDLVSRLAPLLGDSLLLVDGLPTAEITARAYLAAGASTYSSAIFNFMPRWAIEFHSALVRGDHAEVDARLRSFVVPFIELRDRQAGYAVSIVKAAMRAVGRDAGPVRPPLVELTPDEHDRLRDLVAAACPELVPTDTGSDRHPADV